MTPSTVRLKQLAEAATPGPWEVSGTGQQVLKEADVPYGNQRICETNSMASHYPGKTSCWANLSFIAAANPQAVLGLIARIEKLEAALTQMADFENPNEPERVCWPACDYMRKAREALKEET